MPDRRNSAELHAYTRQDYANFINGCLRGTVENFIEAGSWLIEARQNLAHGEFEAMVREDLNISPSTARKLRLIAGHSVLANRSHGNALPPCWTTLYHLSKLKPTTLEALIEDGTVNPKMERKEAEALLPAKSRSTVDAEDDGQQGEEEGDDVAESDFEAVEPEREQKDWKGNLISGLLELVEKIVHLCEQDPSFAAAQDVTAERLRQGGRFLLALAEQCNKNAKPTIARQEPQSRQPETGPAPITETRLIE